MKNGIVCISLLTNKLPCIKLQAIAVVCILLLSMMLRVFYYEES